MFSPAKKEDKQFLLVLAELIEILVRVGTTKSIELAEKFYQENYSWLENRINTHEYTKDDTSFYQLEELLK